MISKNGVFYELKKSCFRVTIDGITFVFSSNLHLQKFLDRLEDNRNTINKSLSNRFNLNIKVHAIADMTLYRKIETRGFYVLDDKGNELCQNNLILDGLKTHSRN